MHKLCRGRVDECTGTGIGVIFVEDLEVACIKLTFF